MKGKIKTSLPKDHGLVTVNDHEPIVVVALLRPVSTITPTSGGQSTVVYVIDRVEMIDRDQGAAILSNASNARHGRLSLPGLRGPET